MLVYSVIATLPDAGAAAEYVAWLTGGHTRAVIAGGAASAEVVRVEEPAEPVRVESRYVFASRADYDRYLRDHAPALRADGMARFGTGRGVTFERRIGRIV